MWPASGVQLFRLITVIHSFVGTKDCAGGIVGIPFLVIVYFRLSLVSLQQ